MTAPPARLRPPAGPRLGASLGKGRDALAGWLAPPDPVQPIAEGTGGIPVLRRRAPWVVDYHADGEGQGFPWDRP